MKTSTGCKLAGLVVLGMCSMLLTSAILAQHKGLQPARENAETSDTLEQITKRALQAPPAEEGIALAGASSVGRGSLDRFDVSPTPNGEGINVSAEVTLMDKMNLSWGWTLSIRDAADNEVVGFNYEHQIFKLPQGETKSFTFDEAVPLAPGTYIVELRLWHVRPDANLTTLRNMRNSHQDARLAGVRQILVGG